MSKLNRIFALLLAALFCVALIPMSAFAKTGTIHPYGEGTITIQSEYDSAFDYLEYFHNGEWKDLNTPRHWIVETGEDVYCIEHSSNSPHGGSYEETSPSALFGTATLEGLESIFEYGYPCVLPDGFTPDEARQATANAIRFWLSEQGEPGSYSFTNRAAHPDWIRAKSGYEHVLTWADELLEHARNRDTLTHSISFNPTSLQLTKSGDSFTGQTRVRLTNINSGYTLDTSELPNGVSVTGYTGTGNDTLVFTAPANTSGSSFVVTAEASDTRCIQNLTAYAPMSGSAQKVFMSANIAQVVATASVSVNTEAFGGLRIVKKGDNGALLGGVKFGIYSDHECQNLIKTVTTRDNGVAAATDLPVGIVYVKEISTVAPYWIDYTVYTVEIPLNDTIELEIVNESAKGRIRIEKTGEAMTSVISTDTEWGTVNAPVFTAGGLEGAVFQVLDSHNNVVETITTDEYGVAESGYLDFGDYSVVEIKAPDGYLIDSTYYPVTLSYQDGDTPVVVETVEVFNDRQHVSLKLRKMTEEWNDKTFTFDSVSGANFVFGLYTAEAIGILPMDTLVEVLITNDRGTASTRNDLPAGHYYIRELAVPDPTIWLSTESYPVDLTGDTEYIENMYYFTNPIVNDMFKTNIAVWKLDQDTHVGLPGAVFEVFDDAGVVYCTMTTDSHGYAVSIDLPIGSYHIREIQAPDGYVIDDEIIDVVITTEDKNTMDARVFFNRVSAELASRFAVLSSRMTELDAYERLRIFHDFFRSGEEEDYRFDFDLSARKGHSFIDAIAPSSMSIERDYIRIGDKYARVLFLKEYPSFLKDSMVREICEMQRNMMFSIDIIPVPTEEAVKEVERKLLGTESDITKWQQKQNKNNNFSAVVPYPLEQQRKESTEYLNDLMDRDQRMMFVTVTAVHMADTLEQLDADTEAFLSVGRKHLCDFDKLTFQQLQGLITVLPYGLRKINAIRTLTTESTAVLMPFSAQEIAHDSGFYCGQNAISRNLIFVNRETLLNGNGFYLGTSGSGKSFFAKKEIIWLILMGLADVIVMDPESEYGQLIRALGGEVIRIAADSKTHINAMDMDAHYSDSDNPLKLKAEFMFSLCEQLMGAGHIGTKEKTIIDRCTTIAYREYLKNNFTGTPPTLKEFHKILLNQPEPEAKELALAVELFADGSLNTFAYQTNVATDNPYICYDIHDLGPHLRSVGMLVVLDSIYNRILRNRKQGRFTFVFIDEIYLLFGSEYSSNFLLEQWKRARKCGACYTGISQNVEELLKSDNARTMLANSEFITLLNQAATDRQELSDLLGISDTQLSYVSNAEAGKGLLLCSGNIVPFEDKFPKDSELYKLMTTKPREMLTA